ncbi:MAG: heme ABC exporter ATP-binding protein CcmA [Chloroflexaceae bacterium]|jgi:heme ABC exporter ATP-binding subunit CcmA|nr:heme ABC exporter ATP-binding protein CcmA [Chloroflexaceae bacterium]
MIEFAHIHKRYGAATAIADLSLMVKRGELLALVGPNGAGKTTLIRVLLGLVRPTAGTVCIDGHDVQRDGVAARLLLGYLPQRAVLYGNLTVHENLAFVAQLRGVSPVRIAEVLALVRLAPVAERPARTLSGGMLQRLGLAQALLASPPVLVLDEPTVSLDPQSTLEFKELLRALHAAGTTVLLSSHILGDVQEVADRVAILDHGRLVALDSVAALAQQCALPERLRIQVGEPSDHAVELARRAGAATAELHGETLEVAVPRERKLAVLQALMAAGVVIRDFSSAPPTLEAIFLQLLDQPVKG